MPREQGAQRPACPQRPCPTDSPASTTHGWLARVGLAVERAAMIPASGPSPPSHPASPPSSPARFLHLLLPQTSRASRQLSPNVHRLQTLRRSTTTTTRRHILRACDSCPPQGHIFVTWMAPSKTRGARAAWGPGRHLTVVNVSNDGHVTDVLGLVHDGTKLGDGKVHLRTGEKKEAHAIET